MMTVRELFNDGMALLGIQNPDVSPQSARDHVLQDITAALQLMQLAGEDFYCRAEETVSLAIGTGYYDLPSSVQTVLEPARLSGGKSLIGLGSRTQLDDFGPLFLGSNDAVANGSPLAFFVEALKADALTAAVATGNMVVTGAGTTAVNGIYIPNGTYLSRPRWKLTGAVTGTNLNAIYWMGSYWQISNSSNYLYQSASDVASPELASGWAAAFPGVTPVPAINAEETAPAVQTDSVKLRLHVIPKPSATDTLTLNVVNEPPVYAAADLCGTSPVPPVPHKYHESILLPLVRKNVTLCDLFVRHSAKLPLIEADYQRALTLLGLADPRKPKPPGSSVDQLRPSAPAQGGQQQ